MVGRTRACWAAAREEAPGRGFFAVWVVFSPLSVFSRAYLVWFGYLVLGLYEDILYSLSFSFCISQMPSAGSFQTVLRAAWGRNIARHNIMHSTREKTWFTTQLVNVFCSLLFIKKIVQPSKRFSKKAFLHVAPCDDQTVGSVTRALYSHTRHAVLTHERREPTT